MTLFFNFYSLELGLASNLNGSVNEVTIYNSLNSKVDKRTHNQLICLLRITNIRIFELQPQIQEGVHDCDLFALSFCISLANEDVCSVRFNQSLMRKHLEMCFERKKLLQFPKH